MKEEWNYINENYKISNYGRVISLNYKRSKKEKELEKILGENGYYFVSINGQHQYLHKLIAEAFIPIPEKYKDFPPEELIVHHINGNQKDNRIENLMWLSRLEHQRIHNSGDKHYAFGKGFSEEHKKNISEGLKGHVAWNKGKKASNEARQKMSEAKKGIIPKANPPKKVYQYTLDRKFVNSYSSTSEASRQTGFNQSTIAYYCRSERKEGKGYIWSYEPL